MLPRQFGARGRTSPERGGRRHCQTIWRDRSIFQTLHSRRSSQSNNATRSRCERYRSPLARRSSRYPRSCTLASAPLAARGRGTAGARAARLPPSQQKEHAMIDLYYWTTPNGHKVTIFLEESGLAYRIIPVNISKGDQFKPEFLAISPNNRIPAILDREPDGGGAPISLFESGAILLYLAEKTGKFIPKDIRGRAEVLEWL